MVRDRAKKRKLQFDEEALDLFVLLTGGDTRQIDNELEKIDLYLGADRRVRADQVRDLVPLSRAGVIFELGNALASRDLYRALALVRRLLDQGESAIGLLLVAVLPTVRNLLLAKDLMEQHGLSRPSARTLSSPRSIVCRQVRRNICRARRMGRSTPMRSASPRSMRIVSKPNSSLPDWKLSRSKSSTRQHATRSRADFDRIDRENSRQQNVGGLSSTAMSRDTEVPPHLDRRLARLLARDRSDVGNIPAHAAECFHHRDDHHDEKRQLHDRLNHGPQKDEQTADRGNGRKNHEHDLGSDVEQEPRAPNRIDCMA